MRHLMTWSLTALMLGVPAFAGATPPTAVIHAAANGNARTVVVHCDKGETVSGALTKAGDPLEIVLLGTCHEEVSFERDRVTFRGGSPDALLVGGIEMFGSSSITVRDLTIRGSQNSAIAIRRDSGAVVRNVRIEDSSRRGILLEGSAAEIDDTTIIRGGEVGILNRSSRVDFGGTVTANENRIAGMSATDGGVFLSNPATLITDRNLVGFVTQLSSETTIAEGLLSAKDNTFAGIAILGQGAFAHGTAVIESKGNGVFGVWVDELSNWSPFLGFGATVDIEGNGGPGVFVERSSTFESTGTTEITGNGGPGLQVDASLCRIAGTAIHDNTGGSDVVLGFGSRASFNGGNGVPTPLACDGSALVRGDYACPSSLVTHVDGADRTSTPASRPSRAEVLQALRSL